MIRLPIFWQWCVASLTLLVVAAPARSESPSTAPKAVPRTRVEMKQALEALKQRMPRLPMPPKESNNATAGERSDATGTERRSVVNNGRMRGHYLPSSWQLSRGQTSARPGRSDSEMNLNYAFKTRLFWIVSRVNNCHYCLGHQEHKLLSAGMLEDDIAALDSQWDHFSPADQAALALARKLTMDPHKIVDEDIDRLRKFFDDRQIVEIVFTIASNNSTNRWTDSLGIPQDERFRDHPVRLDTPTSEAFRDVVTNVARVQAESRGALPADDEVALRVQSSTKRTPRVAMPAKSDSSQENWVRMLSYFPETAVSQAHHWDAVATEGRLSPQLKAQIARTTALENRAWYAAGHARARLERLGTAVESADQEANAGETAALEFARKLTSQPQAIADADIARLQEFYSDHEVAEIVYATCLSNWFDRFTEALAIPLESGDRLGS